jgi:hypothetical protein
MSTMTLDNVYTMRSAQDCKMVQWPMYEVEQSVFSHNSC